MRSFIEDDILTKTGNSTFLRLEQATLFHRELFQNAILADNVSGLISYSSYFECPSDFCLHSAKCRLKNFDLINKKCWKFSRSFFFHNLYISSLYWNCKRKILKFCLIFTFLDTTHASISHRIVYPHVKNNRNHCIKLQQISFQFIVLLSINQAKNKIKLNPLL